MTKLEYALSYAKRGWYVFPLKPKSKQPATKNGFYEASLDTKKITKHWTDNPNYNIGIRTGKESDLVVIDIDPKHDGFMSLRQYEDLPDTFTVVTGSKGKHYYFQYDQDIHKCDNAGKCGKGIDIKTDGGYVVGAGSIHDKTGNEYIIEDEEEDLPLARFPEDVKQAYLAKAQPQKVYKRFEKTKEIPQGSRHHYFVSKAGMLYCKGMDVDEVTDILIGEFGRKCPDTPLNDIERSKLARIAFEVHENYHKGKERTYDAANLDVNKSGVPLKNMKNTMTLFRNNHDFHCFAFNAFAYQLEIIKRPEWEKSLEASYPRKITDEDICKIKHHLIESCNFEVATHVINEAVTVTALENSYHPVIDYLTGLKWDRKKRVERLLPDYYHTEDDEYTRWVSKMMLVSACARVDKPGCKYDYMIVLEGGQGIGKTLSLEILGGEWYNAISLSNNKFEDTVAYMNGTWIAEPSEMGFLKSRKDHEELKAFLTTRVDKARLSYERHAKDFPRQSIFIGTINPEENGYLSDPTGNRRYLPVKCGDAVDINGIQRDRDQLWAEAWTIYKTGKFRLYADDKRKAALQNYQQQMREVEDSWGGFVKDWLKTVPLVGGDIVVTLEEVFTGALNGRETDFNRNQQMRICNILKKLRFRKSRKSTASGTRYNAWVKTVGPDFELVNWDD